MLITSTVSSGRLDLVNQQWTKEKFQSQQISVVKDLATETLSIKVAPKKQSVMTGLWTWITKKVTNIIYGKLETSSMRAVSKAIEEMGLKILESEDKDLPEAFDRLSNLKGNLKAHNQLIEKYNLSKGKKVDTHDKLLGQVTDRLDQISRKLHEDEQPSISEFDSFFTIPLAMPKEFELSFYSRGNDWMTA